MAGEFAAPTRDRPRPRIDDASQTIHLPEEGKDRPACMVHLVNNVAVRRPYEITDKDYTKALLSPILVACRGCSKSFPGAARLTEMLMHIDSKQHSKACGIPIDDNPLYKRAMEVAGTKKKAEEETPEALTAA